jgi:hypothetical protein
MLGIKQITLAYYEIDGSPKTGEVFFFGNPCENIDYVYASPFRQTNIPPACLLSNIYNRDKIIELTDLKSLLIQNVKMKENLSDKMSPTHPLQLKINFIKDLISETALSYLKYINKLMWVDTRTYDLEPIKDNVMKDLNNNASGHMLAGGKPRWKETGISFDTAVEFCRAMTKELSIFFSLMIDLRYDAGLMHDRLESDFTKIFEDYKFKSGYESNHNKGHKSRKHK